MIDILPIDIVHQIARNLRSLDVARLLATCTSMRHELISQLIIRNHVTFLGEPVTNIGDMVDRIYNEIYTNEVGKGMHLLSYHSGVVQRHISLRINRYTWGPQNYRYSACIFDGNSREIVAIDASYEDFVDILVDLGFDDYDAFPALLLHLGVLIVAKCCNKDDDTLRVVYTGEGIEEPRNKWVRELIRIKHRGPLIKDLVNRCVLR